MLSCCCLSAINLFTVPTAAVPGASGASRTLAASIPSLHSTRLAVPHTVDGSNSTGMSTGAGPVPGLTDPGRPFITPMSADSVAIAMRSHKAMLQTLCDDFPHANGTKDAAGVEGSGEQGSAADIRLGNGIKRGSSGAHMQHPTSQGDPGSAGSARAISADSPDHPAHGAPANGRVADRAASGQEGVSNGSADKGAAAGFHMPAYMSENQMNALAGRQALVEEADIMKTMLRRMDEVKVRIAHSVTGAFRCSSPAQACISVSCCSQRLLGSLQVV
jgi:hypothetical protein